MRYHILLAIVLVALWLAISGIYTPLVFSFAVVSVTLVLWLSTRMDVVGREHNPSLFSWRLPVYWLWLLWQVVLANVHVAKLVFRPGRVSARIFTAPAPQKTAIGRVTYANSITVTPGTITMWLDKDQLQVHAVDEESADGVKNGEMAAMVSWLEGAGSKRDPS
ncbi:MAG TPA: Na+/H+ antiporter subunit E [Wenzhouxiangella sp.]|nr:Na+/H+ antiporter subunit E [Wenzhouxiangella sp.]HLS04942.1 Na+/H+ antiporter subunit E [Wenzhouxiangella sp.]